jgi:hypothetical protein
VLLFARAMLDSGEYQRCAHMLRQRAQVASSPIVQFISMYSLYMVSTFIASVLPAMGPSQLSRHC